MKAGIIGTGSYAPEHSISNAALAQMVDTNDPWIREHTGIAKRRITDQGTVMMAVQAANRALADSGVTAEQVDLIIVATVTPDYSFPNTAAQVQAEIGAVNAVGFDLSGACSGFLYAMSTANAYICSGMYRTILVIGAETLSKIIDWTDRSTSILFGDGAGAVVMQAADRGIVAVDMGTDGSRGMVLRCAGQPLCNPLVEQQSDGGKLHMDGAEVFKFAVRRIPQTIMQTLAQTELSLSDIDYFVFHQANQRIVEAAARRLQIPMDKIPMNIQRYGNLAAASIPMLLDEANREGTFKRGDLLMIAGFGAGLSWGSALLEW